MAILSLIIGLRYVQEVEVIYDRLRAAYPANIVAFFSFVACLGVGTYADVTGSNKLARTSILAFYLGLFALGFAVLSLIGLKVIIVPLV